MSEVFLSLEVFLRKKICMEMKKKIERFSDTSTTAGLLSLSPLASKRSCEAISTPLICSKNFFFFSQIFQVDLKPTADVFYSSYMQAVKRQD